MRFSSFAFFRAASRFCASTARCSRSTKACPTDAPIQPMSCVRNSLYSSALPPPSFHSSSNSFRKRSATLASSICRAHSSMSAIFSSSVADATARNVCSTPSDGSSNDEPSPTNRRRSSSSIASSLATAAKASPPKYASRTLRSAPSFTIGCRASSACLSATFLSFTRFSNDIQYSFYLWPVPIDVAIPCPSLLSAQVRKLHNRSQRQ